MLEGLKELGEEIAEISGCDELGVITIPEPNGEPLPLPPNGVIIYPPNGEPFIPSPTPPPIHGIAEWLKKNWPYLAIIGCFGAMGIIFLSLAIKKK